MVTAADPGWPIMVPPRSLRQSKVDRAAYCQASCRLLQLLLGSS
jgi:hypothetical protein